MYTATGDVYEGQYKLGKRIGRGKMILKAGGLYEGFWQEDLYHGIGH